MFILFNEKILFKFKYSETVVQRCSLKQVLLKISQISQENNCFEVSFEYLHSSDSNGVRTHSHFVHKRILNHLAKRDIIITCNLYSISILSCSLVIFYLNSNTLMFFNKFLILIKTVYSVALANFPSTMHLAIQL